MWWRRSSSPTSPRGRAASSGASAVATAVGIGALLSNSVAGFIAHRAGTTTAFLVLAAIGGAGLLLFAFAMPETLERGHEGADPAPAGGNDANAAPVTLSC